MPQGGQPNCFLYPGKYFVDPPESFSSQNGQRHEFRLTFERLHEGKRSPRNIQFKELPVFPAGNSTAGNPRFRPRGNFSSAWWPSVQTTLKIKMDGVQLRLWRNRSSLSSPTSLMSHKPSLNAFRKACTPDFFLFDKHINLVYRYAISIPRNLLSAPVILSFFTRAPRF